mgnify:CR=1 FL=1
MKTAINKTLQAEIDDAVENYKNNGVLPTQLTCVKTGEKRFGRNTLPQKIEDIMGTTQVNLKGDKVRITKEPQALKFILENYVCREARKEIKQTNEVSTPAAPKASRQRKN